MSEQFRSKTLGVMQPYIFPYVGYFSLAAAVDTFVFLDDVQMIKRGWVNRNNILLNGEAHRFTIPLVGSSQTKNINQVGVTDDYVPFLRLVENGYAKAPFRKDALALISDVMSFDKTNLATFAANSIKQVCAYIGLKAEFLLSSEVPQAPGLRAQDKIIEINKALSASRYVNPIGGTDLYDGDIFAREGIDLLFVKAKLPEYPQNGQAFVPGLSIIDLLMFLPPDEIRRNVSEYQLIESAQFKADHSD